VITDADLSYDPKTIPQMLLLLAQGYDYVIGSRYVKDASNAQDRGLFRWLNSSIATLLARPFTSLKDPMSGHIAFRRSALENAPPLRPLGYKIGLELIVKCGFNRTAELPIDYVDRKRGQSKLSLREQWLYCRHIGRLFVYKYVTRK
jgi:dolichol-phosphate mannosyltransferase